MIEDPLKTLVKVLNLDKGYFSRQFFKMIKPGKFFLYQKLNILQVIDKAKLF